MGFGNLGHLVAVHLIYLHRSLFAILLDDDVLVVHSDCGVVSLYRGWCTVAVGLARAKAGIMAAIIITFLIFIILYFMLFLILIEKIPEEKCCFYLLE